MRECERQLYQCRPRASYSLRWDRGGSDSWRNVSERNPRVATRGGEMSRLSSLRRLPYARVVSRQLACDNETLQIPLRVNVEEELSDSEFKELDENVIREQSLRELKELTIQSWVVYEVIICVKGKVRLEIVRDDTPTEAREKDGQRIEGEEVILSSRKRGTRKFTTKSTLDDIDTVEPLRRGLRQPMQCTILEYLAASRPARDELQMITRKTRIPLSDEVQMASKQEVLPSVAVSGVIAKAERAATVFLLPFVAVSGVIAKAERAATVFLDGMEGVPPYKFYILGSGTVQTTLNDEVVLHAVIDNGSEAVIIDEELVVRLGLDLDRSYQFEIETVDGRKQKVSGFVTRRLWRLKDCKC
ncbi:hypothetical protein CBR_g49016 [Chara braunii]|uniref:Uncharacterized protein n=1 Tax=Chara braunii TaxID=69332 RepID=A0A388M437_CHABU|nr:hypothetical protein CBR_g49016 [Chara braunii]|eukprot:GBG89306.1 hypothetical protein CBR_g49016 [Chara braunii]